MWGTSVASTGLDVGMYIVATDTLTVASGSVGGVADLGSFSISGPSGYTVILDNLGNALAAKPSRVPMSVDFNGNVAVVTSFSNIFDYGDGSLTALGGTDVAYLRFVP